MSDQDTEQPRPRMNAREAEVYDLWKCVDDVMILRNGWPDFLIVGPSGVKAIEVKAPGGKLTPEQILMHMALEGAGIPVQVVEVGPNYTLGVVERLRARRDELLAAKTTDAEPVED